MSAAPKSILNWLASAGGVNAHQLCVSPGDISGSFGVGDSTYKLTFDIASTVPVPGNKPNATTALESIVQLVWQVLGYAKAAADGSITRFNPKPHPECPWLYASKIALEQGVAPYGTMGNLSTGNQLGQWHAYRVAIMFETPPYAILSDGVPEYRRNTFIEVEPATEFITRQNGSFIWPPGAPRAGQSLSPSEAQSVAQRISKTRLKVTWVNVPDKGLFGAGGFASTPISANIESAVGTVNNAAFMNRDAGTMLLTGWKPIPKIMPVPPAILGSPYPRAWDVELHFSYFRQQDSNVGVPGVVGHNCVPSAADGKWYRVFLQGTADSSQNWRYQETDFSLIFKMNG